MTRWIKGTVWGLSLALLFGGSAFGKPPAKEGTCTGEYGTSIHFEDSPSEAAKMAKKDGKLVLVLHVSGHFEDPSMT